MSFSSQHSQWSSPSDLPALRDRVRGAFNDDEPEAEQWWRPAILIAAIGLVVLVHWWILR